MGFGEGSLLGSKSATRSAVPVVYRFQSATSASALAVSLLGGPGHLYLALHSCSYNTLIRPLST